MKIFSTAPEGNEAAELENAHYIKLAIKKIDESKEWLENSNKPYQAMLTHVDILLMFAKKFPVNVNLLLKKEKIFEWKSTFDAWYERCNKKIPSKYREGIKANADELFDELIQSRTIKKSLKG
ncbi:hypothetical protein [Solibacillus sp. FSL K6-1523]|uniref:hypothetical protein n=1 Tax=Solibacillus sp. FSL K6-1523 TaxID=2921471 RepID=UPI0030FA1F63